MSRIAFVPLTLSALLACVPALGWLAGTVIDTAFDPANDTALRRLMSIPGTQLGLGIPPSTALAIEAGGSHSVRAPGPRAKSRPRAGVRT